jgi:hypothetical protein
VDIKVITIYLNELQLFYMRRNIVLIVVGLAVITGFSYFALFSTPAQENFNQLSIDSGSLPTDSVEIKVEKKTPQKGFGTMNELRLLNENIECTIIYTPAESGKEIEGTFFANDERIRADFLIDSPDQKGQILSSIIIENNLMYVWSDIDGDSYGFKTDLGKVANDDVRSNEPVPVDQNIAYDCKPWELVDNTVFVPPTYVLFNDLDQLKQRGMEYGTIYDQE